MQKHTTIELTQEQRQKLEAIARRFNLYQTRGAGAGKLGSISQLMQAVADGKILLLESERE